MSGLVTKDDVIKSMVAEWNRKNAWKEGGLKLAYIEKAVHDTPPAKGVLDEKTVMKVLDEVLKEATKNVPPESNVAGLCRAVIDIAKCKIMMEVHRDETGDSAEGIQKN